MRATLVIISRLKERGLGTARASGTLRQQLIWMKDWLVAHLAAVQGSHLVRTEAVDLLALDS